MRCLHIGRVLYFRLDICERICVTPNALSRRSGQIWWSKIRGDVVLWHPILWKMTILEKPSRLRFEASFMMSLNFLSQALGKVVSICPKAWVPTMVKTDVCKLENWVKH